MHAHHNIFLWVTGLDLLAVFILFLILFLVKPDKPDEDGE